MFSVFDNGTRSIWVQSTLSLPSHQNVVLVRTWKRNPSELADLFSRLQELNKVWSFDLVAIAIDRDQDNGMTSKSLSQISAPFPVRTVEVSGPSDVKNWTRLLNGVLYTLHLAGVRTGYLFPYTTETVLDLPSFYAAMCNFSDRFLVPCVSIRNTPTAIVDPSVTEFLGDAEARIPALFQKLVQFLSGEIDHFSEWQCLPVLLRNTGMVWPIDTLFKAGGFDPRCNDIKGQEELALICRLLCEHAFDLGIINMRNTFRYDDPRLNGDLAVQKGKMRDELSATEGILSMYRLYASCRYQIPVDFPIA